MHSEGEREGVMGKIISAMLGVLSAGMLLASPVRSSLSSESARGEEQNDVVAVEYLESTGGRYLLFPEPINGIECDILPGKSQSGNNGQSAGRRNGLSRFDGILFTERNGLGLVVGTGKGEGGGNPVSAVTGDLSYDHMWHIVVHGTEVAVDGVPYTLSRRWGVFDPFVSAPFALFGVYNTQNGAVEAKSARIGACALFIGEEKIYDLQPIRIGGAGYILDLISGEVFGGEGTGEFLAGPDVRQ